MLDMLLNIHKLYCTTENLTSREDIKKCVNYYFFFANLSKIVKQIKAASDIKVKNIVKSK